MIYCCIVCSTAVSCPSSVPNGKISEKCDLVVGSTCNYKCNAGYEATDALPNVTCTQTGKWITDHLCIGICLLVKYILSYNCVI